MGLVSAEEGLGWVIVEVGVGWAAWVVVLWVIVEEEVGWVIVEEGLRTWDGLGCGGLGDC